jgi:hypothetical protein
MARHIVCEMAEKDPESDGRAFDAQTINETHVTE